MLIHNQMRPAQTSCPACGNNYALNLGKLRPRDGLFHLNQPGCLYECANCSLLFRHPYLSVADLEAAYSGIDADAWQYENSRPDHQLAAQVIEDSLLHGRVLDIGCFRGDFLNSLETRYEKFGVEMSPSAREIAEKKGITVISSSIEEVKGHPRKFDAVTALDVLEHLPEPLDSLQTIAEMLEPEGLLIVSTGNSNTIPWRLSRLDYWYYFPEHVSFFNPNWFHWATRQLTVRLELVTVKKFSHYQTSAFNRLFRLGQCTAYAAMQRLNKHDKIKQVFCSVYPFSRVGRWTSAPGAMHWQDHMLLVLKRIK